MRVRSAVVVLSFVAVHAARMSLHKAAEEGQIEPLKVAIDGRWDEYEERRVKPDIDGRNKKGNVALHLAACNQRVDIGALRVLLEKGANANARDGKGKAALHLIAGGCNGQSEYAGQWYKFAAQGVKLLLKHGADVDATNGDGLTALHVLAAGGHSAKLFELLIARGASVDALDRTGATPLLHAVRKRNAREVLALLKAGADPDVADAEGHRARDVLTENDSTSVRIRKDLDGAAEIRREALEARANAKTKRSQAGADEKSEL